MEVGFHGKKIKKRFSKEFNESAVKVVEEGNCITQVARVPNIVDWQQNLIPTARKRMEVTVDGINCLEENKRIKKNVRLQQGSRYINKGSKVLR